MARRILTALVGVPLLIGAVWLGFPYLTVLVAAAALLGLWEFYRMGLGARIGPILCLGALWVLLFIVAAELTDREYKYGVHLVLGGGLLLALPWLLIFRSRERAATTWAFAVAGPVCVGFLLVHSLMLRGLDDGTSTSRDWLLFTFVVIFANDTGALFTGRSLGRHLLAPLISPNKTVEGAIGGFAWAVGVALVLWVPLQLSVPLWQAALMGIAISALAQVGDLAESCLKRAAGVKDAGGLLPGHGGILDRVDSMVFTLPVVYYIVTLVLKPSG